MLQFIKWFVVSKSSFNNLKIPYLRNILDKTLNIPSYYSFRSKLLPCVLDKLYFAIENKLKKAVSVSLVLDLWTNNFNTDFIACAAMLSYKTMEEQSLVIGMTPMPGIVCDEGSSLVKLFSQIDFSIEEYDIEKNTDEKNFDEPAIVDENIYQENEEAQMTENYSDDDSTAEFDKVYKILKMSSTDEDIIEIFQEFQELNYKYEISSNGVNRSRIIKNTKKIRINTIEEYDLTKGEPLSEKEVELGVNKVPRFSCACHKANLAVRHAISMHKIGDDLKKLNLVNSHIRKSIQLNKTFNKSKARLRLENATRWSSAFLMAYDKELFNEENEDLTCPLSLKEVETYLQILRPAYRFSLTFQNSFSSISHLIPSLKRIFFSWENMDLEHEFERLAILLVVCFKEKFKYELESEIYQAATVLNLALVKSWIEEEFCQNLVRKGLHSLKLVYLRFFFDDTDNDKDTITLESPQLTIQQTDNEAMFFDELMRDGAMKKKILNLKFIRSKLNLIDILNRTEILVKTTNMAFWNQYMDEMPRLARLALNFLNSIAIRLIKRRFIKIRKFELLAELLAKDVRIEKPGILLTAPIDEPGPLSQEPIPELISEDVVADENTPTTSSAVMESSGDEEEQLPKQLTRASLKREMTISKSFEMLSVRIDQDWLNLQRKQSNNDSLNRMARDNFAKNEELHIRISRLEKNLGEINKKMDALECLPKILEVLSSNQKPIFS
ncbi:hypothetical protein BpHYR1_011081 [Brachionus plicatilis]|uniref:Uncharacterized protein n=1 Tax=Brachionus plicatilis TaxID=10195 RepID=A0A3M7RXZ6_BRAPC|nr:hypothetical protein BpHYR1_011081 [Brachionus plicatilis]